MGVFGGHKLSCVIHTQKLCNSHAQKVEIFLTEIPHKIFVWYTHDSFYSVVLLYTLRVFYTIYTRTSTADFPCVRILRNAYIYCVRRRLLRIAYFQCLAHHAIHLKPSLKYIHVLVAKTREKAMHCIISNATRKIRTQSREIRCNSVNSWQRHRVSQRSTWTW